MGDYFVVWFLLGLIITLFVVQFATNHLPRIVTYFLMGCVCSLSTLVFTVPICLSIIFPSEKVLSEVGQVSTLTKIVGVLIFASPTYLSLILIPSIISIGMSLSDRAESIVVNEIRRGCRK